MSISPTEGLGGPVTGLFVPSATTGAGTDGGTTGAAGSQMADKDTFLQLLVAQLKYQDPTNPADTTQFLSQTAQFSALETMQRVADETAQLRQMQVAFGATSLIGRTVSYLADDGSTAQGLVGAVRYDAAGPVLTVDGTDVALTQVQDVAATGTDSPSQTSSTDPAA